MWFYKNNLCLIVKGHCCILVVRLFKMWDIFSVSSGNTWYSTRHKPSKAAPGKDGCKFELSCMMCNIQRCLETRAWKDDGWLEPGAVWMAVLSATGFVAKISSTFSEQRDKSKQQNRVGPTSTELLLALCCLLTVRSKALCDLESFMTLNLLDAEFLHRSFLVSYLFLIHFISPVCAGRFSLDFCVGTGFFWQEHQFKTAWQRFVPWHYWKSSILHLESVVCSVHGNFLGIL